MAATKMSYDDVPTFPLSNYVFPIDRLEHWIATQRDRVWSVAEAERATGVPARRDMISRMLGRNDIEHVDGPAPNGGYAAITGRYRGTPNILRAVADTMRGDAKHQENLRNWHEMFILEFRPKIGALMCPEDADDLSSIPIAEGILRVGGKLHPGSYDITVCDTPCAENRSGCVRLMITLPGRASGLWSCGAHTTLHPDIVDHNKRVLGFALTEEWGSDCWNHPEEPHSERDVYNIPWEKDAEGYVPERYMEVRCQTVRDALLAVYEMQAVLVSTEVEE